MKKNESRSKFTKSLQISPDELKREQQFIKDKFVELLDSYQDQNQFDRREYLCYLVGSLYLSYREQFPDLSIFINFRVKSFSSFIRNIEKEFKISIDSLHPEDGRDSISFEDLVNQFSLEKVYDDINGITIVLDKISESANLETLVEPTQENMDLIKIREDNMNFIKKSKKDFNDEIKNAFMDEEQYYSLKKELLGRILSSTLPERFTEEREDSISYQEDLSKTMKKEEEKRKAYNFSSQISEDQLSELKLLLKDLEFRVNDRVQNAVLSYTLPKVLKNPLVTKYLNADFHWMKDSLKPNGFWSIYYKDDCTELQAESKARYHIQKSGSAYHSGLPGKNVNINSFFTLADPNDSKPLDYYLNRANSFSIDSLINPIELPTFRSKKEKQQFFKSSLGTQYLKNERVIASKKEVLSHLKIKDSIEITNLDIQHLLENSPDPNHLHGKQLENAKMITYSMPSDQFLLSLAEFVSPYMHSCGSAHNTASQVAYINNKNLKTEFAEILRRKDITTGLSYLLIERLGTILQKKQTNSLIVENFDKLLADQSLSDLSKADILSLLEQCVLRNPSLPTEISRMDIVKYAESKGFVDPEHEL